MKSYRVKCEAMIEGRYRHENDVVELSDEKAKVYDSAGLIEPVEPQAEEPKADKKATKPKE